LQQRQALEDKNPWARKTTRENIGRLLVGFLVLNVGLALAFVFYVSKTINDRIRKIISNTRNLISRQPLVPPIMGDDEIAQLDRAFYLNASELLELEKFKDQLVSVVGHDLRTPLTSIQAGFSMLSAGVYGELTPALAEKVSAAEEECSRLIAMVNELLDAERVKSLSTQV
jgi:signal transduction histidine kinase